MKFVLATAVSAHIVGSAPKIIGSVPETNIYIDGKKYGACLVSRKVFEQDYVKPYVPVVPDVKNTPVVPVQVPTQEPTRVPVVAPRPPVQSPPAPVPVPQQPAPRPPVQQPAPAPRPPVQQPAPQPAPQPAIRPQQPAPQPQQPAPRPPVQQPAPAPQPQGLAADCLNVFNNARYNENRAPALQWSQSLANLAVSSADYCANIAQRHTALPSNGGQILFITKTSCSAAIQGWFFDEKPWNGGHYQIIKDARYRNVGCHVSLTNSRCISCNFTP